MSEIPEALEVADIIEGRPGKLLRHLHAENERLKAENEALRRDNERLREALEIVLAADYDPKDSLIYLRSKTREVIKAALRVGDKP